MNISDIFVIFYYDIYDIKKSPLSSLNVNIHSLCTWKNIINVIKNKKYSYKQIKSLESFLSNPNQWRKNAK